MLHKSFECSTDSYRLALRPSKIASGNSKRQKILSLMAVVPNAQKMLATGEISQSLKMLCGTTTELHCHDLGPDHRPPHTAHADRPAVHHTAGADAVCRLMFWRRARADAHACHFLCMWLGTQHRVSMCKNGADAQTCTAQPRPFCTASRAVRRPESLMSEIRVLRSAALPSTAVSRALARNPPTHAAS